MDQEYYAFYRRWRLWHVQVALSSKRLNADGYLGSWFFCAGKPGGMPKGATRGAFRRAMTYSFGSICFGSLVVALINMVRQGVSIAQQQEAAAGNIVGQCAFCCLGCIIGLLDWAVQSVYSSAFRTTCLQYMQVYQPICLLIHCTLRQGIHTRGQRHLDYDEKPRNRCFGE